MEKNAFKKNVFIIGFALIVSAMLTMVYAQTVFALESITQVEPAAQSQDQIAQNPVPADIYVKLNEKFDLLLNQKAIVSGENLSITLDKTVITQCPPGIYCMVIKPYLYFTATKQPTGSETGEFFFPFHANNDGTYKIELKEGKYLIKRNTNSMIGSYSKIVEIKADQTTALDIEIDTGIR